MEGDSGGESFINCGQRQKDRQVVVMNEWGAAPPTPNSCSQARASSLSSNRHQQADGSSPASGQVTQMFAFRSTEKPPTVEVGQRLPEVFVE